MTEAESVLSTPRNDSSSIPTVNMPSGDSAESVDSFSPLAAIQQPPGERLVSESPKPSEVLSRRNILGALAVIPAALPMVAQAATDPIFAGIKAHRTIEAAMNDAYCELDGAECDARKEHGAPIPLATWRNYYIGGSEIDQRREQLLSQAEIDPATVEQEYLDAKARVQALYDAGEAWDERTGLTAKRNELDRPLMPGAKVQNGFSETRSEACLGVEGRPDCIQAASFVRQKVTN